ncbi:hypothetical protein CEXT_551331 [Caerostris extrusa]|uniref:G-protein coupled receptors family 1 profile domain-containing protein n=1 Tax=Caerostris extrusa TaxID=172846 RepID=A0AAV4XE87_CAEEX|nr:hypothetical protein CEXT_551331 [Caerostris extrusa]
MTDKSWLISLFRATVSLYCWYAITLRWKTYSKCIHRLKTLSHLKSSNTMHKIFTASVMVVAVIFPLVFASFNTYVNLQSQDEINTEFWLWGYGMHNSIQRKILLYIIFSTYYWVQFAFPCIVSFVYCTLAWDISRVATHLNVPQGVLDCKEIVQCLDERRKLTDFIDRFESIFTVVAFG